MATPRSKIANSGSAVIEASSNHGLNSERERIFNAFRQWGYLEGDLDPLGFLRPRIAPELQIESEYTREARAIRSEEHTSELQSPCKLVCRLLLEKSAT